MKFWKELIWIVTSAVLVIFILFLGIKLIQVENNQEASAQSLEEVKTEMYAAIAASYDELDISLDEQIADLTQSMYDSIADSVAAEITSVSQQLSDDLDDEIDGVIQYLDGLSDAETADILLYLDGVKAELQTKIDANYTALSEDLDNEISTLNQYLQSEVERLYDTFAENYELGTEYTDSQFLLMEYFINVICEINGLDLPAGYTPPDFSDFE